MMEDIKFIFSVAKWIDLPQTKHAIEKGYTSPKNPDLYVVGNTEGFIHYELLIKSYYESDLDDNTDIEDIVSESDLIGFWSKSGNPLKDLFNRLLKFYDDQQKVLDYRISKNDHSCTMGMLPTQTGDSFIKDHVYSFISSIDPKELVIPSDYKEAKDHIEILEYKYRKFVELFNNVIFSNGWNYEILKAIESYK